MDEIYAPRFQFFDGFEDVAGRKSDVLDARSLVKIEEFFDLALAATGGRLVDRQLDATVAALHYFAHEGRILGRNVFVVKTQKLRKAQNLVVEIDPLVHFTPTHVSHSVVNGSQS